MEIKINDEVFLKTPQWNAKTLTSKVKIVKILKTGFKVDGSKLIFSATSGRVVNNYDRFHPYIEIKNN